MATKEISSLSRWSECRDWYIRRLCDVEVSEGMADCNIQLSQNVLDHLKPSGMVVNLEEEAINGRN